jgi:uncharacterized protein YbjT (DUF2867 family)
MANKTLVTGATGTIGRKVVDLLAQWGLPVAAAVRNPARADLPGGATVEAVSFDMTHPQTFAGALQGVD